VRVEFAKEAEEHVSAIDSWWREHRPAAPNLFTDELDRALLQLSETSSVGVMYRAGDKSVRRLLLRRTHYHVYFVREADRVCVLAVWSAFRGSGPSL
jgi:plasmid stabilization system protein ParE